MFSTPQSKAFFSQEVVKGKLISQQINLVTAIHEKIWQTKNIFAEVIKILWQEGDHTSTARLKLAAVLRNLQSLLLIVMESNQNFSFEINLRADIKQIEQHFFKHVMSCYEEKIKDLKHGLLLLEQQVQQMEKKGYLPYVESPAPNEILTCKPKNFTDFAGKLDNINSIMDMAKQSKLQTAMKLLLHDALEKKQPTQQEIHDNETSLKNNILAKEPLDVSEYIQSPMKYEQIDDDGVPEKQPRYQKNINNLKVNIFQMLKLLLDWHSVCNALLRNRSRLAKQRIEALNHSNKALKQGIRSHKKVMAYEQQEAMVRCHNISFSRQQAIDFVREMNLDLQHRFSRRNLYMIVCAEEPSKRAFSCAHLAAEDPSLHETQGLREVDSNCNDSFMEKCGHLISDRFIDPDDDNEESTL